MTMVNAVAQDGVAYLYADTAIIDPASGRLLECVPKLAVGEHFPWAVGITFNGSPLATTVLGDLNAKSVDRLVEQLPAAIAAFKTKSAALGSPGASMRLVLAAWDEDCDQPRIFLAGDGLDEFETSSWCPEGVTEVAYFVGAEFDPRHHWREGSPNNPDDFEVLNGGLAIFEERRKTPFAPLNGMPIGNYVGGALQMARISRDGVDAVQLHEWSDLVGEAIEA